MNNCIDITRRAKRYEHTNHLGNVMVVVTDKRIPQVNNVTSLYFYQADVVSANDYSPFGTPLPNRSYTALNCDYRFHFNGKEMDSEGMGGGGSTYDYGFRIYNPNLGKFLSVDPLTKSYLWYTPYQFAGNTPIAAIDLDEKNLKLL